MKEEFAMTGRRTIEVMSTDRMLVAMKRRRMNVTMLFNSTSLVRCKVWNKMEETSLRHGMIVPASSMLLKPLERYRQIKILEAIGYAALLRAGGPWKEEVVVTRRSAMVSSDVDNRRRRFFHGSRPSIILVLPPLAPQQVATEDVLLPGQ